MYQTFKNSKNKTIRNISHKSRFSDREFKDKLIENYNLSGLGYLKTTLKTNNQFIYYEQNKTHIIKNISDIILKYIEYDVLKRSSQPIIDLLRNASIDLCLPHLLNDSSESTNIANWNNIKEAVFKKIKERSKLTLFEKINTPIEVLIVYAMFRCLSKHKIIIVPLSVNADSPHANLLIIDFRIRKRKLDQNKEDQIYITTYLFEPNGINFSYKHHIYDKIATIISRANDNLAKIDSHLRLKDLEVIGGDENGLQTLLGEEYRNFFGNVIIKKGYPICASIGYWMIYYWLYTGADHSFPEFIDDQISKITKSDDYKQEIKEDVFNFVKDIKDYQITNYKYDIKRSFIKNLKNFIAQDNTIQNFVNDNVKYVCFELTLNLSYSTPQFNNVLKIKILFKNYDYQVIFD